MPLGVDCARSDGGGIDMSRTVRTPREPSRFLLCEDASQRAETVKSHCSMNDQTGTEMTRYAASTVKLYGKQETWWLA
jgi:hypothetical protein